MKKTAGWIVGALILLGIVGGLIGFGRSGSKGGPRYETAKVERGKLVARVTATGTVSALVTVQVGSQVSGRLKEIRVDYNSTVKKGQVVARIDPQLFDAAVEVARANLIAAQGNLAKSKAQALDAGRQRDRSRQLRERGLIAQADVDTAESNAAAAEAQVAASQGSVEQARAQLHQASINLDYTTIVSPINGVVISRNVDVGQTVAASLQAPTLFTIAEDLAKMQVDTNVAESDVGKLRAGMDASFSVDAYPQERFKGTVRQIRNAPQTLQNVVTYDAVIDVANPELKLKPGMTANVTFVYAERDGALKIPNSALRFRPPDPNANKTPGVPAPTIRSRDAGKTVYVLQPIGQPPRAAPVKLGVTDGTTSELVEGDIKEGDLLVTDQSGQSGGETKSGPPGGAPGGGGNAFRRMF